MTILRYATSSRADGRARPSDWQGNLDSGPEVGWLVAILRVRISPGLTPKRCRLYKDEHTWHLVLLHRQNVVIVGAGRSSRSAKFATSSELLYLLSLLYNMPSECCDEYNLYNLNRKSSVWCFAFSHTSTFELIPAVATAQPGALVTLLTSYNTTLANHLPPSGPRISFLKIPVMISLFSTYIRSS